LKGFASWPQAIRINQNTTEKERREFTRYTDPKRIIARRKNARRNMRTTTSTGKNYPRISSIFVQTLIFSVVHNRNNTTIHIIMQISVFDLVMIDKHKSLRWERGIRVVQVRDIREEKKLFSGLVNPR